MGAFRPRGRLRAYAYGLVTTAIVLMFALAEWATEKYLSDRSRLVGTAVEVSIALVATLAFRPIHQRVEQAVEAAFTKRRREARGGLNRLRLELTSFNDTQQLLRRVVEAIDRDMGTAGCAVYLRHGDYGPEASSFDHPAGRIERDDALVIRLRSTSATADPRALGSAAVGELAFPMMAGGELVGFLTLTPKRFECEPEDREVLGALAEATGLALVALDPRLRARDLEAPFNNLPIQRTPLIGRAEELAEIAGLLEQSRLVTVIGHGGVGKTRAALQVAADLLAGESDGVWFVDLSPLDDPVLVSTAIAAVFNVADEGGARHLIERVGVALRSKRLLIVLDNCEHVIWEAAEAADRLVQLCPGVRILATSREPLGIDGEQVYRMPTLAVPPPGEPLSAKRTMQFGAAALFVVRARAAQRDFTITDGNAGIVADIVRRLDGIALAIELAAPRVRMLSVQQLDQRLDERFKLLTGGSRTALPRHQTLYAMIRWSYDLLSPAEQSMLRQSAVFRGGWTLEAAEAICTDERFPDWDALALLASLVDKSLVVVETGGEGRRYRLLESTRQFVAERVTEEGEAEAVATRHCRYFAQVAQSAGDACWQTDAAVWTAQVQIDLENYRAAISWGFTDDGDAEAAATIVAGLGPLWAKIARREGRALLEVAAAGLARDAPARLRGRLTLAQARLSEFSAEAAGAGAEAARLLRDVDDAGRAEALFFQCVALGRTGHYQGAVAIFEEALVVARATRIPRLIARVLSMAYVVSAAGDRERVRPSLDEAAALLGACNDRQRLASLQAVRAEMLFAEGDPVGALAGVRESEAIFRESAAELNLTSALQNAAAYLLALRRFDEAWAAARESLVLARHADVADYFANAIGHLAQVAAETADSVRAARLLGYSDAVYGTIGDAREATEQRGYARALDLIRAVLPENRIAALMAQGAALEQDTAFAEAMAIAQPAASQR